jgi:tetratricopeptide (TPR) repeat protein
LAVGRTEDATAAFKAALEDAGFETIEEESPDIGEQKLSVAKRLVFVGDVDRALSIALSIPINDQASQSEALQAIVDYHLTGQDFAAAARIVPRIINEFDREKVLLAVVKAWSAAGERDGVKALINEFADVKGQSNARIVFAEALITQGATDDAKAQLDLILAAVLTADSSSALGLELLSKSADLALRAGETKIAITHAEAAFKTYGRPRVFRGAEGRPDKPSRVDLLLLGTVLHLLGQTGKASTLLAKAAEPYPESPFFNLPSEYLAALLVAQIRIDDRNGADATIRQLLAMDDGLIHGTTALHHAAMELVELGFLQDAVQIAMLLEDRLGEDLLFISDEDPAALYAVIVAKDPSLGPELMTDTLGTRVHFQLSLALARALQAKGETVQAQAVLASLADQHQARDEADADFDSDPICAGVAIALMQDSLGFTEDAAVTRHQGLALADAKTNPAARAADLIALAASFPTSVKAREDQGIRAGLPLAVGQTLRCLAYF